MTSAELISASHRNFIGSYRLLADRTNGGAFYEGHGVCAFATGVRASIFNGCIAFEDASEEGFAGALGWLLQRDLPCRVWVHEPAVERLGHVAFAFGLSLQNEPYPGMALHPIPEPPHPPEGISLDVVAGEGMAALLEVHAKIGVSEATVEKLFGRSFRTDPDVRMFCGRLHGEPVGTSLAIRTGDVAGVYAVGTAKSARKRGVGTATTWAAVDAARTWGCRAVVLQSSIMGLSIYRAMGFGVVARYATFRPPEPT